VSITWFDGVTLTVEAALSAATGSYGAWDAGVWDTATWGPDIVWSDISGYVRQIATHRRFSREVGVWEAGTATLVLDNRDGRFSPDNLAGPYVTAGVTAIRPWRPVRIVATYNAISYYVYSGYALDWLESWTLAATGQGDAIVTVPCTDEFGVLAGFDSLAVSPVGAGETAGRRIHRVLDNAGHTGPRAIDTGSNTMQATTLSQNTVAELKLVTDSEGGGLFVDVDGTITFERQYALIENARSNTVQATFGDAGGSELPYSDIQLSYAGDLIRSIVSFARVGGTAQTVVDATARALYKDRKETRTDLVCETDAQALALAVFFLARYKDPERRIQRITVLPRANASLLLPQVLGRRVRDLVRVIRRPPGGHTVTRDCHVAGVHHTITPDWWSTDFDLWSATVTQTYASSRWDVATWDGAAWFF
jgi:hypothetical protein